MYKGQLKDVPQEIVDKLIERQFDQTGKVNVAAFEHSIAANHWSGKGMTWTFSPEGSEFWEQVLLKKNYKLFFDKYPKKENMNQNNRHFIIKKDSKNPLWAQYVAWLKLKYKKEFNNDSGGEDIYYGYDGGWHFIELSPEAFLNKPVILTLEEWANLFLPNEHKMSPKKKLIGYKVKQKEYISAIEKLTNSTLFTDRPYNFQPWFGIKQILDKLGVLDLWCEPVFESEDRIIKMGRLSTFELKVKDGKVFYKDEDITSSVKELQDQYKNFNLPTRVGKYQFRIREIIIEKTGCIDIETTMSEWMAIKF